MNKQKQQSRNWLTQSFLILMEEKPYKEISITKICEKAGLSRKTFYRNFKTKDELLNEYIKDLCIEYFHQFKHRDDVYLNRVSKIFFSFWGEHKDFLYLLYKQDLLYILLIQFNKLLPQIYLRYKAFLLDTKDKTEIEYIAYFNAGGFFNLLVKWLENECKNSPEEMVEIINNFYNLN